ncbi:heme-degrading monooxygenase HmoA [Sphaerotilus hippei]|uniref:Heme-degrading monooxygenase HmoA n=1 Tax=Sphaerotilus hippei TaxID=744406 RepID=A0A318GVA7_9BURK|nr:antibiotic biosynthesis monooxygenase [Sphaerotilus hippei]PXW92790.1 heme-degrading monooxygenase HmoA [Sphaerotilus hippei]
MVLVVFRSRLKPEALPAYTPMAQRMSELARQMPGYHSHQAFTAADGERVTLVEFETEAQMRAWSVHPEHLEAQRIGREQFYASYSLQVCTVERERHFEAGPSA